MAFKPADDVMNGSRYLPIPWLEMCQQQPFMVRHLPNDAHPCRLGTLVDSLLSTNSVHFMQAI